MDPYSKIISAIILAVFGTIFCGLAARIIWDWLKNSRKGNPVPRAGNGFLTLSEIQTHCQNQHQAYTDLMRSEFEIIQAQIQARLDRGDRNFREYEKRFNAIENRLEKQSEQLESIKGLIRNEGNDEI